MLVKLPKLPKEVGFIIREFETPGLLVEDGGKIISTSHLVSDDVPGNEMLFTTTQMREYAFKAVQEERARNGIVDTEYFNWIP